MDALQKLIENNPGLFRIIGIVLGLSLGYAFFLLFMSQFKNPKISFQNCKIIQDLSTLRLPTFLFVSLISLSISYLFGANYYVATSYGSDSNNGTSINTPFKTIGKAASVMSSGDKCYIRQGRYHETITIDDLDGASGSAVVFTNYNNCLLYTSPSPRD